MAKTIIAAKLKQLRKENGVTQVDLAMKSGVGLNFVRELDRYALLLLCCKDCIGAVSVEPLNDESNE